MKKYECTRTSATQQWAFLSIGARSLHVLGIAATCLLLTGAWPAILPVFYLAWKQARVQFRVRTVAGMLDEGTFEDD
jgi:hypothetical protein